MIGWQALFRQFQEEYVLIPVTVLEIVQPKVLLVEVQECAYGQDHNYNQTGEAKYYIWNLASV